MSKHTPGAERAARIIMADRKMLATEYGRKTAIGIADLIDTETCTRAVTAELRELFRYVDRFGAPVEGDVVARQAGGLNGATCYDMAEMVSVPTPAAVLRALRARLDILEVAHE